MKPPSKVLAAFFLSLLFFPTISMAGPVPEPRTITSKCDNRNPDINSKGQVVWEAFCNGESRIMLLEKRKEKRLSKKGVHGYSPKINAKGDVVWQGIDKKGISNIYVYSEGKVSVISAEQVKEYMAPALNDRGEIVFQGGVEDMTEKGTPRVANGIFRFDGKKASRLPAGTNIVRAPHLNNNGAVVFAGWVDKPDPKTNELSKGYTGVYEIFLLDGSGLKRLSDSKTYMDCQAPRVNDAGAVVWMGFMENGTSEIFLYDGRAVKRITDNRFDDRSPRINNKGMVAWSGWDGHDFEIYLYDGKSVRKVTDNDYDDMNPSINDNGDMVWAARKGGRSQIQILKK